MPSIASTFRTIAALSCLAVFVLQTTTAQDSKSSCDCTGLHAGLTLARIGKNGGSIEQSVTLSFLLLNDSASDLDTAEGSWKIVINGKELADSNFIFGNGPGPSGGYGRLSSGANFNFSCALPISKYFPEPGDYKISWKGKYFQSPSAALRIPPVN